ncbi:methyltransferase domain-containing protein [Sphingomonas sp. KR1UV-12]|uniref:Methyltransferase domain-containing protein n=1 Tax=Sphingomonas aurea TaxID=3063994 RepID=A0ABT9EHI4_9SPHN|nr:methyltransferase domain-containing protein [Sphingomonas sp. KR1UV-12]MDP1026417.1 methyltransferase domain-containing protein [Sphingomonas sp. KR1UV-12]
MAKSHQSKTLAGGAHVTEGYYDNGRPETIDMLVERPARVLDIGCGRGGVTRELQRRHPGLVSVGMDAFCDSSHNYRTTFDEFHHVDIEAAELPVDLATFDLVLLLDVLEHLRDPHSFFERMTAQLNYGCYILVSLPNFHYYPNLLRIIWSGRFQYQSEGIMDRTHLRFFGYKDARDMLAKDVSIIRYIAHNPMESRKSRIIGRIFGDQYRAYQNLFLCRKGELPSSGAPSGATAVGSRGVVGPAGMPQSSARNRLTGLTALPPR